LTQPDDSAAAEEYAKDVRRHQEVTTSGYGEAPEEAQGLKTVSRGLKTFLLILLGILIGGAGVATYVAVTTSPRPHVSELSPKQYDLLLKAADPNTKGFNDQAIGAYRGNGYKPVAQRIDSRTDEYYVVMMLCDSERDPCYRYFREGGDKVGLVVYLGVAEPLTDDTEVVRFRPTRLFVDIPKGGDDVLRCAVFQDKAQVGEQGPVTFNLPATVAKLQSFAGNREFTDESPDNGLSFWSCHRQKRS
jgi:hypothetical protein